MRTTKQERKNAQKGWIISITVLCLFFITASFVSCWEKPNPLIMPGEIFLAAGFDASGSSESGSPQKTSTESPKEAVKQIEEPENTVTDDDSDAIPEDIAPSDDPKDITTPEDKKPTAEEIAQAKKEAEEKAKKEAERQAKVEADRLAKIEAERKAKEEAERLAEEKRLADLIGGGSGNDNTNGNEGGGGTDNSGKGGKASTGDEKGSPSGWKKEGELPKHINITVQPGRNAKVTIKYTIDSYGKIKTASIIKSEGLTSASDKAVILDEFKKLKFKPNDPGNVQKGEVFGGTYVWELKSK